MKRFRTKWNLIKAEFKGGELVFTTLKEAKTAKELYDWCKEKNGVAPVLGYSSQNHTADKIRYFLEGIDND